MKILMTADAVGGVWSYAMDLGAALSRRGVYVILAVMGPPPSPAQRSQAQRVARLTLVHREYKLEWMREPWREVDRAGDWLQSLADQEHVDLVHLNGYAHGALDWGRPVLVVAHSCVCSWWEAVHGQSAPDEWDEYRRRVEAGLRAVDHVVAPTHAFLDDLCRRYRPFTPTSVIYNARSPELLTAALEASRQEVIVSCGRLWDEAKNMRALDEAARGLAWPTCVAGDACSPDGAQLSVNAIQLLGALSPDEVASWLKRAEIYVHPAKYEPFGLAPLEAALCGCALVLSDLPSLREIWGDAALFADARDPASLRGALERLIGDAPLRRRLAHAARQRARTFSPERMGQSYLDLYTELLARQGLRRKRRGRFAAHESRITNHESLSG